jgi:HEAT repeat protein
MIPSLKRVLNGKFFTGHASALALVLLASLGCRGRAPYEGKSVAALVRMLHNPKTAIQIQGAYGLSLLGSDAKTAVPDLTEALNGDALVRQNAALALGGIGVEAREAVPALTKALHDPEWSVRRQAAIALGQIGPEAAPAVPALERLAKDKDKVVSRAAKEAISRIKGK